MAERLFSPSSQRNDISSVLEKQKKKENDPSYPVEKQENIINFRTFQAISVKVLNFHASFEIPAKKLAALLLNGRKCLPLKMARKKILVRVSGEQSNKRKGRKRGCKIPERLPLHRAI